MRTRSRLIPIVLLAALTLTACAGGTASPSPSQPTAPATAAPSASAGASAPASNQAPTTPDEAAALVIEQDQQFLGFERQDPNAIGQCCWYDVTETSDGYEVLIHAGWGDCMAGCIENHEWRFSVSRAGDVRLIGESGDPLPAEGIPDAGG